MFIDLRYHVILSPQCGGMKKSEGHRISKYQRNGPAVASGALTETRFQICFNKQPEDFESYIPGNTSR